MDHAPPDDSSTIDTLLRILRHRYRPLVLTFFEESDADTVYIDELVEYITTRNGDAADPDRVRVELHHTALPVLADAGFIDYDGETHTVRCREDTPLQSVRDRLAEMMEDA